MTLKEARLKAGITQSEMGRIFEIPKRTIENWEMGIRKCPVYVEKLLISKMEEIIMKNLQEMYSNWRKAGEEASEATGIPFTWDCGEESAREDFASFNGIEEIEFEEMLELERNF